MPAAVRLGHIHKSSSPFNQHRPGTPAGPIAPQTSPGTQSRFFSERRPPPRSAAGAGATRVAPLCGGERDRTDDLLLAKQALSQLSYTPVRKTEDR